MVGWLTFVSWRRRVGIGSGWGKPGGSVLAFCAGSMKRRAAISGFLMSVLALLPACDPEYNLCVLATSCADDRPILAHVKIQAYALDGNTDSAGKICRQQLNFPKPFEIEVDASGFLPTTEGPFALGSPGTTDFQATVCLEPAP